jgi:hypothetical protein
MHLADIMDCLPFPVQVDPSVPCNALPAALPQIALSNNETVAQVMKGLDGVCEEFSFGSGSQAGRCSRMCVYGRGGYGYGSSGLLSARLQSRVQHVHQHACVLFTFLWLLQWWTARR